MTQSLLLSRYPPGASLIQTKHLIAVGFGLRTGLRQVWRVSHASSSSASSRPHPLSAAGPHTHHQRQQRIYPSSPRPSNTTQIHHPLLRSYYPLRQRRNFTTTHPTFSSSSSNERNTRSGSSSTEEGKGHQKWFFQRQRFWSIFIAFGISQYLLLHNYYFTSDEGIPFLNRIFFGKPLNNQTFVPFTIISRDQVSPTSFIITVKPKYARDNSSSSSSSSLVPGRIISWLLATPPEVTQLLHSNVSILREAWEYGLWSVEIKQPQLQVAREYTPLPSSYGHEVEDLQKGHLRFLIRKMDGGEVSSYLSGLRVGDDVELRGPHWGFDIHSRLGEVVMTDLENEDGSNKTDNKKIVFLAGGTGIAPALQVIRAVLDNGGRGDKKPAVPLPEVSVIWANRHRADCVGCVDELGLFFNAATTATKKKKTNLELHDRAYDNNNNTNNVVLSLLAEAKARHGEKLRYACTVDEEGSFITSRAIADVTGMSSASRSTTSTSRGFSFSSSLWGRRENNNSHQGQKEESGSASDNDSDSCPFHSAKTLITTDTSEDRTNKGHEEESGGDSRSKTNTPWCKCPHDKNNMSGGKNLLIVSGPEGFISTFVGPKLFARGKELQGPVRGVVGTELRGRNPDFWRDWLVLKM